MVDTPVFFCAFPPAVPGVHRRGRRISRLTATTKGGMTMAKKTAKKAAKKAAKKR